MKIFNFFNFQTKTLLLIHNFWRLKEKTNALYIVIHLEKKFKVQKVSFFLSFPMESPSTTNSVNIISSISLITK